MWSGCSNKWLSLANITQTTLCPNIHEQLSFSLCLCCSLWINTEDFQLITMSYQESSQTHKDVPSSSKTADPLNPCQIAKLWSAKRSRSLEKFCVLKSKALAKEVINISKNNSQICTPMLFLYGLIKHGECFKCHWVLLGSHYLLI